jgi:hypothetical protein
MRHIDKQGGVVQLALSEAQLRQLTSWLPEIVAALRKGAAIQANGDEIRVGAKGSLALYPDGGWMDYEADHGGPDAISFIAHELGTQGPGAVRRFAVDWLAAHPGTGSFVPDRIGEAAAQARAERHAAWAREALDKMQPLEGTGSEAYLISRGLPGPYPEGLLGHLPHARLGESALVAKLTDAAGDVLGVQLGYLAPGGKKSALIPQRSLFWITLDSEERQAGLFRIPPAPRTGGEGAALPDTTLLCEGVEKALAIHMAFPGTPVLGVPGIGRLSRIPPIKGIALIVRDGDPVGSAAAKSLTRGIDRLHLSGASAVLVTETPVGMDADALVLAEGIEALHRLMLEAPEVQLSRDGETQRLAGIHNVLEYDEERTKVAKRLGLRKSALDQAVHAQRQRAKDQAESELPEQVIASGPEPWAEPIDDIAAVLSTTSAEIGKYVITTQVVRDIAALWGLHSHFVHHWSIEIPISPRLEIGAISPQCGKTRLLELLLFLVWHPLAAASLTPPVVYRVIDKFHPTMLLDELDEQLDARRHPELVAILRASHNRRFAQVPRNVPLPNGGWDVQMFSAWGTYAYTTVGKIKDEALRSRAIAVKLLRATPQELTTLQPLVDGASTVLIECGRKFARWSQDQIELPATTVPPTIAYRDQDNWRPILRLADRIGGEWPQRARQAAIAVNGVTQAIGDIVPLLTDIREAFGKRERLATKQELVPAILALPEPSADWSIAYRGGPITEYYLRDRLKGVINPPARERRWWVKGEQVRGYLRRHFDAVFASYLPAAEDNLDEQAALSTQDNFSFSPIGTCAGSDGSDGTANIQATSTFYTPSVEFGESDGAPPGSDGAHPSDGVPDPAVGSNQPAVASNHPIAGSSQNGLTAGNDNNINTVNAIPSDLSDPTHVPIGEKKNNAPTSTQPKLERPAASPDTEEYTTWKTQ